MPEIKYTIDAEHDANDWTCRTIRVVAECEWFGTVFSGVSGWLGGCEHKSEEDFAKSEYYKNLKIEARSSLLNELKEASDLYHALTAQSDEK